MSLFSIQPLCEHRKIQSLVVFFILLVTIQSGFSQAGMWSWMKGGPGVSPISLGATYGTQGIPDSANNPPYLHGAAQWTDLQGNFWLFGGSNQQFYNVYNDLWKYDPNTNKWTWVKGPGSYGNFGSYGSLGVSSLSNLPPCRGWGMATWTDQNGDLWLYGGCGYDTVTFTEYIFADLWKYNIASNTWTWMSGTTATNVAGTYGFKGVPSVNNNPGSRQQTTAAWVDATNNLWLFGGKMPGYPHTYKNDLWRYNISTGEWTWMKGSNYTGQSGIYGTKGVPNNLNVPGARSAYCSWTANDGSFWLFGGGNVGLPGAQFNDMWRYEPATNNWTWMSGKNVKDDSLGNFGLACTSSANYLPPARLRNSARWKDNCGNFWLYGGERGANSDSVYSDLWSFNPVTLKWSLANGNIIANQVPVKSAAGVAALSNTPGGIAGAVSWIGLNGDLFLYGGYGRNVGSNNDLWKFVIDATCTTGSTVPLNIGSDTVYCANFNRVLISGDSVAEWSTGSVANQITINSPGVYWASFNTGCGVVSDTITIGRLNQPVAFTLGNDTTFCGNLTYTLTTGVANTLWNSSITGPQFIVDSSGTYWATISNACGSASDSITLHTISVPSVFIGNDTVVCAGANFNLCAPLGYTSYSWANGQGQACIYAQQTGVYLVTVTDNNGCTALSNNLTVQFDSLPAAYFTVYPDSTTPHNWWVLNPVTDTGSIICTWYWGDGTNSQGAYPSHIYSNAGNYAICLTISDSAGCSDTYCDSSTYIYKAEAMVTVNVVKQLPTYNGIMVPAISDFSLFPTPTTNQLHIAIGEALLGAQLNIYNTAGALLLTSKLETLNLNIEVANFCKGVYLAEIKGKDISVKSRWVKM